MQRNRIDMSQKAENATPLNFASGMPIAIVASSTNKHQLCVVHCLLSRITQPASETSDMIIGRWKVTDGRPNSKQIQTSRIGKKTPSRSRDEVIARSWNRRGTTAVGAIKGNRPRVGALRREVPS